MRLPFQKNEPTDLDRAIDAVHARMYKIDHDDPEWPNLLNHLERLEKLRNDQRSKQVSRDVVVSTIGTLVGIVFIVAYEQKHVLTSKAMDFMTKNRT